MGVYKTDAEVLTQLRNLGVDEWQLAQTKIVHTGKTIRIALPCGYPGCEKTRTSDKNDVIKSLSRKTYTGPLRCSMACAKRLHPDDMAARVVKHTTTMELIEPYPLSGRKGTVHMRCTECGEANDYCNLSDLTRNCPAESPYHCGNCGEGSNLAALPHTLYLMRFWQHSDPDDTMLKIGITVRDVVARFRQSYSSFRVLHEFTDLTRATALGLETIIKNKFRKFKMDGGKWLGDAKGHSECFEPAIEDELLEFVTNLRNLKG